MLDRLFGVADQSGARRRPGQTAQTVAVTVIGDSVHENSENLVLHIDSAANAYVTDSFALVDILDDDTLPSISIGEAAVLEPDTGTVAETFPVTLSIRPLVSSAVPISHAASAP